MIWRTENEIRLLAPSPALNALLVQLKSTLLWANGWFLQHGQRKEVFHLPLRGTFAGRKNVSASGLLGSAFGWRSDRLRTRKDFPAPVMKAAESQFLFLGLQWSKEKVT